MLRPDNKRHRLRWPVSVAGGTLSMSARNYCLPSSSQVHVLGVKLAPKSRIPEV